MQGATRRIPVIIIGILSILGLAWFLVPRFASQQQRDPQLEILRRDPMASWRPSAIAGPEQRSERATSNGLITGTKADLLRVIPVSTETGVLDEAVRAAESAGWKINDLALKDTVYGSRGEGVYVVTITLSLVRPPESGIDGPTLLVKLTGT